MGHDFELVEGGDGRRIGVHLGGAPAGVTIVFLHGTPGCGRPVELLDRAFSRHNLRSICPARPGFGASTRRAGRTVGDMASDTALVLDHFGVEHCLVAGWSGGGAHALACAALLADRVTGALVIAGTAPYPADGLDWLAGLRESDATEAQAAIAGESQLRALLEARQAAMRQLTGPQLLAASGPTLPEPDRRALAEIADGMAANFREAIASGIDGWVDDYLAFVQPWGFDFTTIVTPTVLWHGALDTLSPPAHTRWLADRMSGAVAHILPGEGHLSIVVNHIDAMLDELATLGTGRATPPIFPPATGS